MRYATNVWGVNPVGKTDETIAEEGLAAMEAWMRRIGLVMNVSELGVTDENLEDVVKATLIMEGGYKVLTQDDVRNILKASM